MQISCKGWEPFSQVSLLLVQRPLGFDLGFRFRVDALGFKGLKEISTPLWPPASFFCVSSFAAVLL